jgi:hypothetical protein
MITQVDVDAFILEQSSRLSKEWHTLSGENMGPEDEGGSGEIDFIQDALMMTRTTRSSF